MLGIAQTWLLDLLATALTTHDALSPAPDAATETWSLVNGTTIARVRMNVRCASNSGYLLRDYAAEGLGITLLPRWFVADHIAKRRLRQILPEWHSEPMVVYGLYRAAHRNEQRVRLLVDHLRAAYAAEAPRSSKRDR
jgi:DNA-binding transcriptional LysR family regulator